MTKLKPDDLSASAVVDTWTDGRATLYYNSTRSFLHNICSFARTVPQRFDDGRGGMYLPIYLPTYLVLP